MKIALQQSTSEIFISRYELEALERIRDGEDPQRFIESILDGGYAELVRDKPRLTTLGQQAIDDAGFSVERLEQLDYQHNLDCGGYGWELVGTELFRELGCVCIESPPWDYLTGERPDAVGPDEGVMYWAPSSFGVDWPEVYEVEDRRYRLVEQGSFNAGFGECHCRGEFNDDGLWEASGGTDGEPFPDCRRCDGTGDVDRDGGDYAVYVEAQEDEE